MNIVELIVDGFGTWNGLHLDSLSEGLNVVYGPNEAGKSTLLEFVRSMLYGFSPERRKQYLPPLAGGRPGGRLGISGPSGPLSISRHLSDQSELPAGDLKIVGPDGTPRASSLLEPLLGKVDEATFNHVFAVGLREMQELGTLSDTAAADLLYRLSTGLEHVSLVDVSAELAAARERLLSASGVPCQIAELVERRAKLRGEVDELRTAVHRYTALAQELEQLGRTLAEGEHEAAELERTTRLLEIAVAVRAVWRERAALDQELAAMGDLPRLPTGAAERFDAVQARIAKSRRRLRKIKRQRAVVRGEAAGIRLNQSLARQAPRIEALIDQEPWISTLESQVSALETDVAAAESHLAGDAEKLGLGRDWRAIAGLKLKEPAGGGLAGLRPAARAVRDAHARLREAQEQVARAGSSAAGLAREIRGALGSGPDKDLTAALERAGGLVTQLRRRVQLDERLAQLGRHETELEAQAQSLLERQLLPAWVLVGLGGLFILGVVLILAGLFLPGSLVGSAGWALAVLGLGGVGSAAAAKFLLERAAARQLEACQKQSTVLSLQIKQAKKERDDLDSELPRGGGPLLVRLQTAEKDLARLEELLELDARRTLARQESDAAELQVSQARHDIESARRRWRQALSGAGLPDQLSPKAVRRLLVAGRRMEELDGRLLRQRQELEQRRRELEALAARVAQVMTECGLAPESGRTVDRLRQLRQQLLEHQALAARRESLLRRSARLRRQEEHYSVGIRQWQRRRAELLREAAAEDEAQFRRRAAEQARIDSLATRRDALAREIAAALGSRFSEEDFRSWLDPAVADELETHWDELTGRSQAAAAQLEALDEQRGRCQQELKALTEDRRPAHKQVELGMVEAQLRQAVQRWQVLAVTSIVLQTVRKKYEAERQPETLQTASRHLARLTAGRYTRIWTPLDEDVLRVDNAALLSLPVEALSRGTREQLFLSLRLALVSSLGGRGARLPLVLDDVLVNFDARRAKAAAAVLRDFAAEGHQVFVFTCHEHIWKLFKSLKVTALRLPGRESNAPAKTMAPRREPPGAPDAPRQPAARWEFDEGSADLIEVEDDGTIDEPAEIDTRLADPSDVSSLASHSQAARGRSGNDEYDDQAAAEIESAPQVTVVRGRKRNGPFEDAVWHDLVEDDLDDSGRTMNGPFRPENAATIPRPSAWAVRTGLSGRKTRPFFDYTVKRPSVRARPWC